MLFVLIHGGPTTAARPMLQVCPAQYWTTSRGFAVVDVNYRGSTGYGRAYRDRCREQWGRGRRGGLRGGRAASSPTEGLVDPARCCIRGGSAGGLRPLAAALAFYDVFAAGATPLRHRRPGAAQAQDTHKFEARYMDGLVGSVAAGRRRLMRRPLADPPPGGHPACHVAVFQGLDDAVVPAPPRRRLMVDGLRQARGRPGQPTSRFEGEGHGFRQSANIRAAPRRRAQPSMPRSSASTFRLEAEPIQPIEIA